MATEQQSRRGSIFYRLRGRKSSAEASTSPSDASSMFSSNTSNSQSSLLHRASASDKALAAQTKEASKAETKAKKRESLSTRGAFRIETDLDTGLSYAVENTDWPPGVSYKETSMQKMLRNNGRLGEFYEGKGAMAPGGEGAANSGPDPDWIPGLTEEQRKEERKTKKGGYVF